MTQHEIFTGKVNPEIRYTEEGEEQALDLEFRSLARSIAYKPDMTVPRCQYLYGHGVGTVCGETENGHTDHHKFTK
jgi:hypothetical protein